MITLWGPTAAGKTALLSFLYLRSVASDSGWHIFQTKESEDEVRRQIDRIERNNEFPLPTLPSAEKDAARISYDFKDLKSGMVVRLETIDRAGQKLVDKVDEETLKMLAESEGLVFLVDYDRGLREMEVIDALGRIYVMFSEAPGKRAQQDPRPLAVCLSKADQLIRRPEDLRRLQDDPEQFVRDHLSPELLQRISMFRSVVKFFPVSSVGLRVSYGSVQKSVFYDERLVLRVTKRGTPMNIVEPFVWIFEKLREAK